MELVAHHGNKTEYWTAHVEFVHDDSYDGKCSICLQSMKHLELLLDYMEGAHLFKLGTILPGSVPSNRAIFLREVSPLDLINWIVDTFNDSLKTAHVVTVVLKYNHGQVTRVDVT